MVSGKANFSIARTLGLGHASPRLGVWEGILGEGEMGGCVYYLGRDSVLEER